MSDVAERPWWRPKDWLAKTLWTLLFVSLVSLVLVVAWVEPFRESVPATVERVDGPYDATVAAAYGVEEARAFPFLKQSFERTDEAGGRSDTLFPRRAWDGWVAHVAAVQPGADPRLVVWQGTAYRLTTR